MSDEKKNRPDRPETALEEVLHEVEEAERRTTVPGQGSQGGEAAEAITPNTRAQEESRGD